MVVLQFHFCFLQKCAMRSSSIESNNTTIYNRPILCNSQEQLEFFFSSFVKSFASSGHTDEDLPVMAGKI